MDRRGHQGGNHLSLAAGVGPVKTARSGLVALAAGVLFFCYWRQSQTVWNTNVLARLGGRS